MASPVLPSHNVTKLQLVVIGESRRLEEVNACFEEVEKGNIKARIVFDLRS